MRLPQSVLKRYSPRSYVTERPQHIRGRSLRTAPAEIPPSAPSPDPSIPSSSNRRLPLQYFTLSSPPTLPLPSGSAISNPIDASRLSNSLLARLEDGPNREDFLLYPSFLSDTEQRVLLWACLAQLDRVHGVKPDVRKRRANLGAKRTLENALETETLQDVFWPDDMYSWEEGHFDSVIFNFREAPVSAFMTQHPALPDILDRLSSLAGYPASELIMHALHLSSNGYISSHVDNVEASGGLILGVNLGAERVMRMTEVPDPANSQAAMRGSDKRDGKAEESFDVLLQSGSVYLIKDTMRYKFAHEILRTGTFKGKVVVGGQRLSLLLRTVLEVPSTPGIKMSSITG